MENVRVFRSYMKNINIFNASNNYMKISEKVTQYRLDKTVCI